MQYSPAKSRISIWQIAIIAICLCVFLFGLSAKLALYQPDSTGVTHSTHVKLWMGNQKMDVQAGLDLAFIGVLLSSLLLIFNPRKVPYSWSYESRPPQLNWLNFGLFVRPPPIQ